MRVCEVERWKVIVSASGKREGGRERGGERKRGSGRGRERVGEREIQRFCSNPSRN